jgi:hypothetical protein
LKEMCLSIVFAKRALADPMSKKKPDGPRRNQAADGT